MAITYNPITGNFDYIEIPVVVQTNTPTLTEDGDVEVAYVGGNAYFYWRSNGVTYSAQGTAG